MLRLRSITTVLVLPALTGVARSQLPRARQPRVRRSRGCDRAGFSPVTWSDYAQTADAEWSRTVECPSDSTPSKRGNRSNTCQTLTSSATRFASAIMAITLRRQCHHQPADLLLLRPSARPHPHNRIASNAKFPRWQQLGVSSSQYQAAENACQDVLPAGIDDQFPPAEVPLLLTGMLNFSQCMRSNGVPNWPDPTTNPGAPCFPTQCTRLHSAAGAFAADHSHGGRMPAPAAPLGGALATD